MRNPITVVTFAALLVFAAGAAVAQETTGGIAGSVADDLGTPIAGAAINVQGPYGTVTAASDDTGRYRFPRLTPGEYTVTAMVEGYTESSTEVRVILILAGSALALGFEPTFELKNVPFGPLDLIGLIGVAAMLLMLLRRILANLAHLARLEPANVVKAPANVESDGIETP